jgi:uncharacterized membrane protein YfcA
MEIYGFSASLLIGISLGLIGGGGSILTVPLLVYLFHVEPVLATTYSLFIVGLTSLAGVYPKYKQNEISFKTAFIFGIPSILTVYATRAFLVPAIPSEIATIGSFVLTKSILMMQLFALLMVAASFSMIFGKRKVEEKIEAQVFNYPLILLEGSLDGLLTGLLGAGGGFLIIPALVMFSKLPMKQAIGTSLLIIAAKSIIGFSVDLNKETMDWPLLLTVSLLAITGIFIGNSFSKKIAADKLKTGFGWFILSMGIFIIAKQLIQ